jgi:flagellar L-ring protein FlgH
MSRSHTRCCAHASHGAALLLAVLAMGCAEPAHIKEYAPKERQIPQIVEEPRPAPTGKGSLWRRETASAHLFADQRAFRKADIVVVQVEERADAERSADTNTRRRSAAAVALTALPVIGPLAALALGDLSVNVNGSGSTDGSYESGGRTGRTERLLATVPAVVREVLPNGNLIIEGRRVVLVNHEEQHLYVSGIVRPIDIDERNTIRSSMIAEAEIEFVGRGVLTENDKGGWFTRISRVIWPF